MRINRNIVECKCYDEAKASMIDLELIETLWNVNTTEYRIMAELVTELIETLWNVNKAGSVRKRKSRLGINRNIVECKCNGYIINRLLCAELIETLWNVNNIFLIHHHFCRIRINRNIVECKYKEMQQGINTKSRN